jgi:hypothetical protein
LPLLERIINTSSKENDIVLDAFCGCGTALVAAQKLKRQWIGIDISPTACRVMAKRLKKDCGLKEDEKLWEIGRGFVVRDLPKTEEELRKYPPFEFENWAVVALGGTKNARQVGDMGIDGRIYPVSAMLERHRFGNLKSAFELLGFNNRELLKLVLAYNDFSDIAGESIYQFEIVERLPDNDSPQRNLRSCMSFYDEKTGPVSQLISSYERVQTAAAGLSFLNQLLLEFREQLVKIG